jgi:cell division protein ZapA
VNKTEPLTIKILDKDYRIGCPEEEKANLRASADLLNEKLAETKQQGHVIGAERIAIMTALNMCHELLHNRSIIAEHSDLNKRIDALSERISESIREIQLV